MQNNWGQKKWQIVDGVLEQVSVLEVNESLAPIYAQIDAFSQRRHPSYPQYSFPTPRNMTKNDLWIAATAAFLGLRLMTTDADFDHLHTRFFDVRRLTPTVLVKRNSGKN